MMTMILLRLTQTFHLLFKFAIWLPLFLLADMASADGSPTIEEFPEFLEALEPFQQSFLSDNLGSPGKVDNAEQIEWLAIAPAGTVVHAFEENSRFICATIQTSKRQPVQFISRVLLIKPSLLIVDQIHSLKTPESCADSSSGEKIAIDEESVLQATAGDEENSVRITLAMDGEQFRTITAAVPTEKGDGDLLNLVTTYKSPLLANTTVSLGDRIFMLTLPAPGEDIGGGRIAIHDAAGKVILERRPLPAGVLPHGPKGAAMIERWDRAYRDGKRPSWDAREPAPELVRVVELEEIVKPCRAVVLGCGSGDNAIYLAQQGFSVTAIDLAPTALRIAEQKAIEAGVEVNWMLADVLKLPFLEPFDFAFDRGCYHNVRYVDAEGFVESLKKITSDKAQCLILSLNRDGPPGIREQTMRDDFADTFVIEWLESNGLGGRNGENPRPSWSLMLNAKN